MSAPRSINGIFDETHCSIDIIIDLEIDDQIFLSKPITKAINNHIHKESLKPSTPVVSLAHILLQYLAKIRQ